jgi:hypothetical protein
MDKLSWYCYNQIRGDFMEKWKDIDGFEGIYQISNYGRVMNVKTKTLKIFAKHSNGYLCVHLYKQGKCSAKLVHRVVALHFIENNENKPVVNHIDGNKHNNHVDNLEWNTHLENAKHAWDNGLYDKNLDRPWVRGSNSGKSKLDEQKAKEIYTLANTSIFTLKEIAEIYKISKPVVIQIKNKKAWVHIHKD